MPSSEVLKKFRRGKLHSGSKRGPIVRNPSQARAIQISEARDEGHDIPRRKSKKRGRMRGKKRSRGRRRGHGRN